MKFFTVILFCIVLTGASASIFSELRQEIEEDRFNSTFSGAKDFRFIVSKLSIKAIEDENDETEESNKPTKQNFERLITLASKRYNSTLTALNNSLADALNNIGIEYLDELNKKEDLKILTEEGIDSVAAVKQQVANIKTSTKLVRLTEAQALIGYVAKLEELFSEPANYYNDFVDAIALKEESDHCDYLLAIAKDIVDYAKYSGEYVKYCYVKTTNQIENIRLEAKQQLREVYDNLSTIFWEKFNCEGDCTEEIAAISTDLSDLLLKISEINKNEKIEKSVEEASACLKEAYDDLKVMQGVFVEEIEYCYKSSA